MSAEATICQECGMVCRTPTEYHPFAACLMFKACHDGDEVRANLEAVQEHATDRLRTEVEVLRASVLEEAAKAVLSNLIGTNPDDDPCDRWYDRAINDGIKSIRALSGPKGQGSGEE